MLGYRTKRAIAAKVMELMKTAYADIDRVPYEDDPDKSAQAIGRYDGLKIAYELLTGRSPQDVANEVVGWYIHTPMYQEAKKHYDTGPGGRS